MATFQDLQRQLGMTGTQLYSKINTMAPDALRSNMGAFGISPEQLTGFYSQQSGIDYPVQTAYDYLGMQMPNTSVAPAPTITPIAQSSMVPTAPRPTVAPVTSPIPSYTPYTPPTPTTQRPLIPPVEPAYSPPPTPIQTITPTFPVQPTAEETLLTPTAAVFTSAKIPGAGALGKHFVDNNISLEMFNEFVSNTTGADITAELVKSGGTYGELTNLYNAANNTQLSSAQIYQELGMQRPDIPEGMTALDFYQDFHAISDQAFADAINTMSIEQFNEMIDTYGLDIVDITNKYNSIMGTNFNPDQVLDSVGRYDWFDKDKLLEEGTFPTATTGIDWKSELGRFLLPLLMSETGKLPGQAEQYGESLQDAYSSLMRGSLGPQAFQGTLNQLAGRNILDSSVASDALAKMGMGIAQDVGQRGYQSIAAGLEQQLKVPGMLGSLAPLAQVSESTDPLAVYTLLADILRNIGG